jgi:hypothetical protein
LGRTFISVADREADELIRSIGRENGW